MSFKQPGYMRGRAPATIWQGGSQSTIYLPTHTDLNCWLGIAPQPLILETLRDTEYTDPQEVTISSQGDEQTVDSAGANGPPPTPWVGHEFQLDAGIDPASIDRIYIEADCFNQTPTPHGLYLWNFDTPEYELIQWGATPPVEEGGSLELRAEITSGCGDYAHLTDGICWAIHYAGQTKQSVEFIRITVEVH